MGDFVGLVVAVLGVMILAAGGHALLTAADEMFGLWLLPMWIGAIVWHIARE